MLGQCCFQLTNNVSENWRLINGIKCAEGPVIFFSEAVKEDFLMKQDFIVLLNINEGYSRIRICFAK
jgi:hypothetical protein